MLQNINKRSVGIAVTILMVLVALGYIYNNQATAIKEAKEKVDAQEKIIKDKSVPSEIEVIKADFDKNKSDIIKNKETWDKAEAEAFERKSNYEQSVWRDRCLAEKLVDSKVDCTTELERFKEPGLN